jgi:hypothetical protein
MVEQYPYFGALSLFVVEWGCVAVVVMTETGDATGALGLFQILVSYNHFHYVVLCIS